ncbi:MAG: DUF4361 domain-containing protein [Tannerella sp.]|jgi:hypothetical protein|nr:DUF4361 domain-containing protein [Tannerella sp.]
MKKYLITAIMLIAGLSACKEENFSSMEYYKYVLYMLSKEDYNVYSDVFPYSDGVATVGYFSIGCGGSLANPEEVTVYLENDTVLLNKYNRANYDIDTSKYARLLSDNNYSIETMQITVPAGNIEQYVKVAVSVLADGLSPDSTYFIPLAIKNVSRYEVNPDKFNMLFRIVVENHYAGTLKDTYYSMKGNTLNNNGEILAGSGIAATKLARPISKNAVRIFAGTGPVKADFGIDPVLAKPTLPELNKYGITLTVDASNRVTITPYAPFGSIEVEQIDGDGLNIYAEERNNMVDDTVTKYFYLRYRYRTLKTPATDTSPAVYNAWVFVNETLKRLEE